MALETQLTISVDVTNNGEYSLPHDEVVMVFAKPNLRDEPTPDMSGVYHSVVCSSTVRPLACFFSVALLTCCLSSTVPRQMLLGFTRITTKPGATITATVEVAAHRLRLVGADGQFGLLHGDYELHVGGRAPGYAPASGGDGMTQVGAPLTRILRVID